MKAKYIFFVLYVVFSFILFSTFFIDVFVWLSFLLSFLVITIILYYHIILESEYSPFLSSYIVFNYLFFLVAPIIQIGSFSGYRDEYATFFNYQALLTIKTNALIILFNIVFFLAYLFFKKKYSLQINRNVIVKKSNFFPLTILTLFSLTLFIFFLSFNFVLNELSRPNWLSSNYSIFELLVQKKVLFILPLSVIALCIKYFKYYNELKINKLVIFSIFILSILILLWFKNPLTEKRNALGPIYITLIFLLYPKALNTNFKILSFLFLAMVLLFPALQIFTHIDYSFARIVQKPSLLAEEFSNTEFLTIFNTLNYDAFSNISVTIEYVSINGLSYGYQALSGLLFFIPRFFWENKPISTGELIGDYLVSDYGFNFTNLSNPLVSEGYINFGWLGVMLFSISLAFFCVRFLIWLKRPGMLKKVLSFYFAIHLIFLLRGDFTNGFSYFIGTLIGLLLIPVFIKNILRYMFKR